MKHIVTFKDGLDVPVSLHQRVNGKFAVIYGADVRSDLTYEQACRDLGSAILHSLTCAGSVHQPDGR